MQTEELEEMDLLYMENNSSFAVDGMFKVLAATCADRLVLALAKLR